MQQKQVFRAASLSGIFLSLVLGGTSVLQGQEENRSTRVPLIGNVSGGSHRQAFSGIVQKMDVKRKLLLVETVEGGITEYFPVKKDFRVSMASGKKIKASELSSGTNVIVYFEVNEARRTVTDILVLGTMGGEQSDEKAKKPSSPS